MKIHFKNANIVPMNGAPFFGELVVDGEQIVYLGGEYLGDSDRQMDCRGDILMPSLIDTHTHLGMGLLRGQGDGLKLRDWLHKCIFPLEARLDEKSVCAGIRLGLAELIAGGVTGVVDMYPYPLLTAKLLDESGIEGIVTTGDNDLDGGIKGKIKRQEEVLKINLPRVCGALGFHAEYTCSEPFLEMLAELAMGTHSPVVFHNSETLDEVGRCCTRHDDLSPTMYLHSLGLLEYGGLACHAVYCDKDDLALLKQCGVAVSLNIASNCKLGSGIPPVVTMWDKQNLISLGTDSAASNNRLDMWRELYLTAVLPKAVLNAPEVCPAKDVLRFATVNGAEVLRLLSKGRFTHDGTLREGGPANLIRVRTDTPAMCPLTDCYSALVYSGSAAQVVLTMCRGKILFEDGQLKNGWALPEILQEANSINI